jgi:hypothetical protein
VDLVADVGQEVVDAGAVDRIGATRGDPGVEDAEALERAAAEQVVRVGRSDVAQAAADGVDAVGDRAPGTNKRDLSGAGRRPPRELAGTGSVG